MNNEPELKVRKKRYDLNFKRFTVEHWLGSGNSAWKLRRNSIPSPKRNVKARPRSRRS